MWSPRWSRTRKRVYWVCDNGAKSWDAPPSFVDTFDDAARAARSTRDEPLRRASNQWKQALVDERARGAIVLDLGCGRGGDIFKFARARARAYLGVDASAGALAEACARAAASDAAALPAEMTFLLGDLASVNGTTTLAERIAPRVTTCASCFFALPHLVTDGGAALGTLLHHALADGGVFVGIAPDARKIAPLLATLRDGETVTLVHDARARLTRETALTYTFEVHARDGAHLVHTRERLVPWPALEEVLREHANLRLISLRGADSDVCDLFASFVFERIAS